MKSILFKTPYPRPTRLSDPFCDFDGDASYILKRPDEEMRWEDFRSILNENLPAGTYEESVYFLPLALDFMRCEPYEGAFQCQNDVIGWIANCLDHLRADGLEVPARDGLRSCFETWTSRFSTIHDEPEVWRRMRWSPSIDGTVLDSETISTFIESLTRFEPLLDIAELCIDSLALQQDHPGHSAWFLEYARSIHRDVVPNTPHSERILKLTQDRSLLQRHAQRIRETLYTAAPMYWDKVFKELNLG